MQQMEEPPQAAEPSRRRPPRRRSQEPVPLPEDRSRSRRRRTVKLQEVLKAYQRAVIEVLEQRLAAASEAAAEAAREAVTDALAHRPRGPDEATVAKGVLAFADERFQAMSMQLGRIEEALRTARQDPGPTDADRTDARIEERLDALGEAVVRLADGQRRLGDEVIRRTGQGVVGVAKVIRDDLDALREEVARFQRGLEDLDRAVRSMHRTLAWEGMRTPRSQAGSGDPESGR
jgi:hypothetical protein